MVRLVRRSAMTSPLRPMTSARIATREIASAMVIAELKRRRKAAPYMLRNANSSSAITEPTAVGMPHRDFIRLANSDMVAATVTTPMTVL